MAYLKKEQYEYRAKSAAKRVADNEQIAVEHGMTEEQAALISRRQAPKNGRICTMMNTVASIQSLKASIRASRIGLLRLMRSMVQLSHLLAH